MPSRKPPATTPAQPVQYVQQGQPVPYVVAAPAPIQVVYERPKPRIAKGIAVLLLGGPLALIIFAMGQSAWGALWRAWLTMIGLYVAYTVLFA